MRAGLHYLLELQPSVATAGVVICIPICIRYLLDTVKILTLFVSFMIKKTQYTTSVFTQSYSNVWQIESDFLGFKATPTLLNATYIKCEGIGISIRRALNSLP
jgi:hypothetical protein